jgi:anthranilate/para-aminobenzoate synthase component II
MGRALPAYTQVVASSTTAAPWSAASSEATVIEVLPQRRPDNPHSMTISPDVAVFAGLPNPFAAVRYDSLATVPEAIPEILRLSR